MEQIPDTGGGLSGFVAYGLWHVYRHFPFEGTWDWLVLVALYTVLVPSLFLPYMSRLAASPAADRDLSCLLWDVAWIAPAIWLFHTPAGQTFVLGRQGTLLPESTVNLLALVWVLALMSLGVALARSADDKAPAKTSLGVAFARSADDKAPTKTISPGGQELSCIRPFLACMFLPGIAIGTGKITGIQLNPIITMILSSTILVTGLLHLMIRSVILAARSARFRHSA